jgi:hypothetical protein
LSVGGCAFFCRSLRTDDSLYLHRVVIVVVAVWLKRCVIVVVWISLRVHECYRRFHFTIPNTTGRLCPNHGTSDAPALHSFRHYSFITVHHTVHQTNVVGMPTYYWFQALGNICRNLQYTPKISNSSNWLITAISDHGICTAIGSYSISRWTTVWPSSSVAVVRSLSKVSAVVRSFRLGCPLLYWYAMKWWAEIVYRRATESSCSPFAAA